VASQEGLDAYFDASRFASDVCDTGPTGPKASDDGYDGALSIASSFAVRLSLMNPPDPINWIARLRLILRELPTQHEGAKVWAERLQERLVSVFGLTFDEIEQFVAFLTLWSFRFKNLAEVFKPGVAVGFKIDSLLSETHIYGDKLSKFFERTARRTIEPITDDALGGQLSVLPFRDRPFIEFEDGTIAPVHPSFVAEKLTYDLFWWAVTPGQKQDQPWQRDWGDLVELYVVQVLAGMAVETGCGFAADIKWDDRQIDAAMWFKGHVALFEISASMMTDAEAYGGDPKKFGDGLLRTLVRRTDDRQQKDEALAQVARDAKALLTGELVQQIPVTQVTHVYPVVIAVDRRVRTPGLRFWFDKVFASEVADVRDARLAPLAVLGLEDVETIEQLVADKNQALSGTPRGLLRLLRMWQMQRDKLPKSATRAATWHHLIRDIGVPRVNARLKKAADAWWTDVRPMLKLDEKDG
jgi:hypothetical protein